MARGDGVPLSRRKFAPELLDHQSCAHGHHQKPVRVPGRLAVPGEGEKVDVVNAFLKAGFHLPVLITNV
jgi:hypothetical protein